MGSFFIPMSVMIYVYVRISCVVASRHDEMTEIEVHRVSIDGFDLYFFNFRIYFNFLIFDRKLSELVNLTQILILIYQNTNHHRHKGNDVEALHQH